MYQILPHTADVRLRVSAPDLNTLFEHALQGMFAILGPSAQEGPVEREVHVESADLTALLVDFLNEALSLALTRREAYVQVARFQIDPERHSLTTILRGHRIEGFDDEVKAVTYHEAELVQTERGWETMLVFDV